MSQNDPPRSNGHDTTATKAQTDVSLMQDGQPWEAGEKAMLSVEPSEHGPQIHSNPNNSESLRLELPTEQVHQIMSGLVRASAE